MQNCEPSLIPISIFQFTWLSSDVSGRSLIPEDVRNQSGELIFFGLRVPRAELTQKLRLNHTKQCLTQLTPKKNCTTKTSPIAIKAVKPSCPCIISDFSSDIFILSVWLSQPPKLLTLLGTQDCRQQGNQKSLHGRCALRA